MSKLGGFIGFVARASLCSALLSAALVGAHADSSVWAISSSGNTLYLGGTIHMLRPSDYPLPEEYEQAYQDSSGLFSRLDPERIQRWLEFILKIIKLFMAL